MIRGMPVFDRTFSLKNSSEEVGSLYYKTRNVNRI